MLKVIFILSRKIIKPSARPIFMSLGSLFFTIGLVFFFFNDQNFSDLLINIISIINNNEIFHLMFNKINLILDYTIKFILNNIKLNFNDNTNSNPKDTKSLIDGKTSDKEDIEKRSHIRLLLEYMGITDPNTQDRVIELLIITGLIITGYLLWYYLPVIIGLVFKGSDSDTKKENANANDDTVDDTINRLRYSEPKKEKNKENKKKKKEEIEDILKKEYAEYKEKKEKELQMEYELKKKYEENKKKQQKKDLKLTETDIERFNQILEDFIKELLNNKKKKKNKKRRQKNIKKE